MRSLLTLLLLPSLALAQTSSLPAPPVPPRGVTLPPTSTALVQDATAVSVNPAGLNQLRGLELFYFHERDTGRAATGHALLYGQSVLGVFGFGLGAEWLGGRGAPDYRKLSLGLSLGGEALSLGAVLANYSAATDVRIERLITWDLGLLSRPTRWLSVGAVVRNMNEPQLFGTLPRQYDLSVGVRPLGERWTLGAGYVFSQGAAGNGRLTYTLQLRPWNGVGVLAGLSHHPTQSPDVALQLGLALDLEHLGVTYAAGRTSELGRYEHTVGVRLSTRSYPALRFDRGTVAMLDLDDLLSGGTSPLASALGVTADDPFLRTMRLLDAAAEDDSLEGVVVKIEGLPDVGWGKGEELRQRLLELRRRGKKVAAVLMRADDVALLVASGAERIYTLPQSTLVINGLSATVTTVGGTMQKLGVTWDVARVGQYKTAPEQLTRTEMSEAQREVVNAYLDTEVRHYEAAVSEGRHVPVERLHEAWKDGLLTAARAKALGLVDDVLTPEELEKKLGEELVPGARFERGWRPAGRSPLAWGTPRRVAVVPVIGSITGGKSREDPLGGGAVAGSETVVRALRRAADDPTVAAIVLRVDSGGGDVLASDLMYRAVLEAKKKKPVVASMGDVAASGGYYAAMGADEIFASPTTLTGSIGVFFLKPALQGLLHDKLGVNQESVSRAPLATLTSGWAPWTEAEAAAAQAWVDAAYDSFITEVAQSRKLDKGAVDQVARGRVWSGADAKARGLVDGFGGLLDAARAARRRAGVPERERLELAVFGDAGGLFASMGGEPEVLDALLPALPPSPLQRLAAEAGLTSSLALEPGLQAALPWHITVR